MSEVTGISRTNIQRILKHYKWHPYKIQLLHELNEDDHDRRLQFCEIISNVEWLTEQFLEDTAETRGGALNSRQKIISSCLHICFL
nr:unnamed protein product [Callosobruchus chinensis]